MSASRRTVLLGLAALPLPAAAVTPHLDAALLALEPNISRLEAEVERAQDTYRAAEEAAHAAAGPKTGPQPDSLTFPSIEAHRAAKRLWDEEFDRFYARLEEAEKRVGITALDLACADAEAALDAACAEMAAIRATTLAGMILKARVAELTSWDLLTASIVTDLLSMRGEA